MQVPLNVRQEFVVDTCGTITVLAVAVAHQAPWQLDFHVTSMNATTGGPQLTAAFRSGCNARAPGRLHVH